MKFILEREQLIKPLQQVSSSLSGRPVMPILSNLLLQVSEGSLSLTGTDTELEMVAIIPLNHTHKPGTITVPARKFLDICRSLPEGAEINVTLDNNRILVRSGRSRFSLTTLPASTFPKITSWESDLDLNVPQETLKRLIEATQFSMAQQDVRYYLNGMLFEAEHEKLRTVATDGHRLAVCTMPMLSESRPITPAQNERTKHSVIVPRKGIIELARLLESTDKPVKIQIGSNNLRIHIDHITFTSTLIEGRFPDYHQVLPKKPDKILEVETEQLKHAFSRAAILSSEKYRGVRLLARKNQIKITANNPEQEEAEEILDADYQGDELEIGFNVAYILDVLNAIKSEHVRLLMKDPASSVQIESLPHENTLYVVMPMRL